MATIRTILPQKKEEDLPILRVAAYCRVSSDSDDQMHSFAVQTEYYTKLIGENPLWTLADIYADEGITGTNMKHRDEFMRMIADCKKGKIDRILTKSVSRFARNTVDCLETVRLLSSLGISVLFEKEQLDTAKMTSEVLLGFMSTQAQDESISISGNMRWSYEKRMKAGRFSGCRAPYGYQLHSGTLQVDDAEAETVRLIFQMYLSGSSIRSIVSYLNSHDIPRNGREEYWSRTTIRYILSNERYIGDALLQKYYTTEGLSHRIVKNNGERTAYYVENNHPPIISRDVFDQVQSLLNGSTAPTSEQKPFLSGKIICPDCGHAFRRIKSGRASYWKCGYRHRGDSQCRSIQLNEESLLAACNRLITTLIRFCDDILTPTIRDLEKLHGIESNTSSKIYEIDLEVGTIQRQLHTLSALQTQGILEAADFIDQTRGLNQRISTLRSERSRLLYQSTADETLVSLNELQDTLQSADLQDAECDESLRKMIIQQILVKSENEVDIAVLGGLQFHEKLPTLRKRCKRT